MGMNFQHLLLECTWDIMFFLVWITGYYNELCSSLTPDLGSFLALWDAYCIPLPKHIQESNRTERRAACQGGEQKCSQTERAKVTKQVSDRLVTRAWRDSWLTAAALLQTCCRFTQNASGGYLCLRGLCLPCTPQLPRREKNCILFTPNCKY